MQYQYVIAICDFNRQLYNYIIVVYCEFFYSDKISILLSNYDTFQKYIKKNKEISILFSKMPLPWNNFCKIYFSCKEKFF